jgi:glycosyltransferase involved in cell wall biosynthesis
MPHENYEIIIVDDGSSQETLTVIERQRTKSKNAGVSLDENPNWDYQEKLSEIADRYHLG